MITTIETILPAHHIEEICRRYAQATTTNPDFTPIWQTYTEGYLHGMRQAINYFGPPEHAVEAVDELLYIETMIDRVLLLNATLKVQAA